jgi:hypothetical protein
LEAAETEYLRRLDLQKSLAKVLALQHTDEALGSVFNALGNVQLGLEAALGDPLLHGVLVRLVVNVAISGLANKVSNDLEGLGDNVESVLDAISLILGSVVIGNLVLRVSKKRTSLG